MLLEWEESNRQRLTETTLEEAELQEDASEVSEFLVDPDLVFSETRDRNRIKNWVHNTSTADLIIHVTTAELENFPNKIDTLSVAGTSHFHQPQAPRMNDPSINNQSPQMSADGQTNPVSLNLPTLPPLVNLSATSVTQPNGIEAQPILIALTRNTVHQEQSIVNPAHCDLKLQ